MSKTSGTWTQDGAFTDGQIFVGPSEFIDITASGAAAAASSAAGLFTLDVTTANHAAKFFADISKMLRTGQYASFGQQAFGTTGPPPVPGPTTVANTSSPDGTFGRPPLLTAKEPTILGPVVGAIPKGLQINSVDVIYEVDTTALAAATLGLTKTAFSLPGVSGAPTVTNLIALAANGLPTATNTAGQSTTTRVLVPTPAMLQITEGELILNINLTLGASGTLHFYGAILNCNFNYN